MAVGKRKRAWLLTLFLTAVFLLATFTACTRQERVGSPLRDNGVDPDRGRVAFTEYGCPACHTIPGVIGANATVGPPLTDWADRSYIAGQLPNTPENLITWIMSPTLVNPETAMPDEGVPEAIARDMAAYLYTLTGDNTRRGAPANGLVSE